jgi:putative ABC transport system permease protein
MTALAIAFALSTSLFNATFAAQSRVDAQLTNGSDVTATTSAGGALPPTLLSRARALPGVAAAETMQHRFAYVGNDLQDLYGIHPASFGTAAPVSNAFFANGNAQQTFAQLAARPDGVLVSDETVKDFQLQPGDLLRLRLQVAGRGYSVIPFHYVGIVREFPTAPSDSFIVANASYVGRQTHSSAAQTLLTKTTGSPPAVAGAVRNLVGPSSGVTVTDLNHQLHQTLSGLPAIDLSGLTRVELFFALLLAAGASGLVLILGLTERARTFAILAAIGARAKQLGSFVWTEASFVTFGGIISGVVIGWVVAFMLVKILTGVFDPPPEHLSIPFGYLVLVGAATLAAVCAAAVWMVRATRKPAMTILRDL